MNKRGVYGEDAARVFLEKKGFRHLESNFYTKWGEIDLIMEDGATLVFVEVKHRSRGDFGQPEEMVGHLKQKHIERAAIRYVQERRIFERAMRFDVVAIGPGETKHYENAFMASGNYY